MLVIFVSLVSRKMLDAQFVSVNRMGKQINVSCLNKALSLEVGFMQG